MGRYTSGGVGRDMLAGALAGAAAIWVADKLDWSIYRAGGPDSIRKTEAARPGGMDPAHVLAKRAADKAGVDIGNPKDNAAGHTVHYAIGAGMGALYGALRGMSPAVSTGRGALFGLAMFILEDEVGNTVMGTGGNPLDYPIRDHARGAVVHTLFGIVTDLGTRLLAPWRDEVVIEEGPPLSERLEHGRDYLYSQGQQYLDQGRGYLDQGRQYAERFIDEARARLPEVDTADLARRGRRYASQAADTARAYAPDYDDAAELAETGRKRARRWAARAAEAVRAYAPDYDDAAELAETGRKRARRWATQARSQLPDIDTADVAKAGRRQANRFADEARSRMPEVPTSGLSRALNWLFG